MNTVGRSPASSAVLSYFSLFTSVGTLLCCALPSLLVLAGLGASVASTLSALPWLVTLSRHKHWTFAISGTLAHLGLGRSYAIAGDAAKSRAAYNTFLTLWKDADPNIPILKQATTESAKLQ
jgi:hypothetical protein